MKRIIPLVIISLLSITIAIGQQQTETIVNADHLKQFKERIHTNKLRINTLHNHSVFHLNDVQNPTHFKSSSEVKQALDSIIGKNENGENNSKMLFTYDENGNNVFYSYSFWDGESSDWEVYWEEQYIYENNHLIQILIRYWNENDEAWRWHDNLKYTYNTDGQLIKINNYKWDDDTNDWKDFDVVEFTYHEDGNLNYSLRSKYDLDEWKLIEKMEYTYNSDDQLTETLLKSWIVDHWIDDQKNEYVYNGEGYLTDIITHVMGDDNSWHSYTKRSYTYDEDWNRTSDNLYYWNSADEEWQIGDSIESTFASNGNMIDRISDYPWDTKYKNEFHYNDDYDNSELIIPRLFMDMADIFNHMMVKSDDSRWDIETEEWRDIGFDSYHYSDHVISDIPETTEGPVAIYPNPASDYIIVDLVNNKKSTLEIYDLQGRMVINREIQGKIQISLTGIDNGLYIYKLSSSGIVHSGKFLVE